MLIFIYSLFDYPMSQKIYFETRTRKVHAGQQNEYVLALKNRLAKITKNTLRKRELSMCKLKLLRLRHA